MGTIIFNGEVIGGGSKTNTRFVSDPTDKNYGWFQYELDGAWVNLEPAFDTTCWLYHEGENYAEFSGHQGGIGTYTVTCTYDTITLVKDTNLTVKFAGGKSGAMAVGSAMSKLYDLTDYDKLIFDYECTAYNTNDYNKISVFVTKTLATNMSALAERTLMTSGTSVSGYLELDISSITGECYIGICVQTNINTNGPLAITLINPYLA